MIQIQQKKKSNVGRKSIFGENMVQIAYQATQSQKEWLVRNVPKGKQSEFIRKAVDYAIGSSISDTIVENMKINK